MYNNGLTDEEQDVMDSIGKAHRGILDLGLDCNEVELAQAIHVLQGFVKQRVLARTYGTEYWSDWFGRGSEA